MAFMSTSAGRAASLGGSACTPGPQVPAFSVSRTPSGVVLPLLDSPLLYVPMALQFPFEEHETEVRETRLPATAFGGMAAWFPVCHLPSCSVSNRPSPPSSLPL